ncbi:hypothetical protein SAMN05192533_10642 [Mesobacillus persicus]|uniref:Group-specific protein n=1 Tax=Mesobacillus persicus TaxID=930146 RepID=A0A1H8BHK3_9BACI|nr:hypothetical protein [Mesobacillus persicus]SEM82313.1 hypothetical protein SAMN05192533_10642 [Mesobacillus persicus]
MFDPTAFDNMKVVVEGAIYDRDLDGELLVTSRNDVVNLATLSRTFDMSFSLRHQDSKRICAKLTIEAGLQNLAAELLKTEEALKLTGCVVTVEFHLKHYYKDKSFLGIQEALESIWGTDRKIKQLVHLNPLKREEQIVNIVSVQFNRLILEEQVDDLIEMIDYLILSLKELEQYIFNSK